MKNQECSEDRGNSGHVIGAKFSARIPYKVFAGYLKPTPEDTSCRSCAVLPSKKGQVLGNLLWGKRSVSWMPHKMPTWFLKQIQDGTSSKLHDCVIERKPRFHGIPGVEKTKKASEKIQEEQI